MTETTNEAKPFLKVVRGDATPEEVAALVAVIASLSGTAPPAKPKPKPRSTWADPRRRVRITLPHGPGAWRASGLPH